MTASTDIRVRTALADGQLADDALMVHNIAVDWGHDDLAVDQLDKHNRSIAYLFDDAVIDATAAGVKLQMATAPGPRCAAHPRYLHQSHGGYGCPICL